MRIFIHLSVFFSIVTFGLGCQSHTKDSKSYLSEGKAQCDCKGKECKNDSCSKKSCEGCSCTGECKHHDGNHHEHVKAHDCNGECKHHGKEHGKNHEHDKAHQCNGECKHGKNNEGKTCDGDCKHSEKACSKHGECGKSDTHNTDGLVQFGTTIPEGIQKVDLNEILSSPEQYLNKTLVTEGKISKVCQSMGCWMELVTPEGKAVRVPTENHAFFLPKDASGKQAEVYGFVQYEKISESFKEHLKGEGAEVLEGKISFVAKGVKIK